jgi:chemotaxis protein methyltransferase CheR
MMISDSKGSFKRLSDQQFNFLTAHLSSKFGLKIPQEKRTLLESRIVSRMNKLGMRSLEHYIEFAFSAKEIEGEYRKFVDQITTHKTFFFREKHQFDFLTEILPSYVQGLQQQRPLYTWSAGCSTGEEVFTLGMCFKEQKQRIPTLDYRILGTDISVPSLEHAAKGVFSSELENLPAYHRDKYFEEVQVGKGVGLLFKDPEIKSKIQLGVLNLKCKNFNLPYQFDFIFCRNVTIYFDIRTREQVLHTIVSRLRPGGYLFLGHSETALGMSLPVESIKPTIYRKEV